MENSGLNSVYTETMSRSHFGGEALYLKHIQERVVESCPQAIEVALGYMATTTRRFGHNRFRAKFARQLKHIELTPNQKKKVLDIIYFRFRTGDIDEQFIEQLRYARWANKEQTINLATELLQSEKQYVVRFANKVLRLGDSSIKSNT